MSTIRLTRSGLNVAGAVRAHDDVVTVEEEVAAYLCSSGQAVRVGREQVVETAVQVVLETTDHHATARRDRRVR